MRPYMRAANVTWQGIDLSDVKEMDFTEQEQKTYALRRGDILLSEASGSASEVGKPAIWRDEIPGACFQNTLIRVRANNPREVPYLYWHFMSDALNGRFADGSRGTGIHHLGAKVMDEWPVSLAPLAQQERVVAAIETHTSRIHAMEASLRRAKTNVKRARASVLKAAVEGRLVTTEAALSRAESRDFEPASTLLARILTERRACWADIGTRGKYKEPVEPEIENSNLPEGWTWASIEQLATLRGGVPIEQGWSPKCDDEPAKQDEWAVITTTAIQARSFVPEAHKRLPDDLNPKPDLQVEPGDILITRAGPRKRAGVSCLVRRTRARLILCDKAYRFRVGTHVYPAYVEVALNSHEILEAIEAMKSGISDSGVNLTQKAFLALVVPLPPLAEQHRIVAEVDRRLSVLDALDATLDANLARCAKLRQSILKRAFEGKLVRPDASAPAAPQLPLFTEEAAP